MAQINQVKPERRPTTTLLGMMNSIADQRSADEFVKAHDGIYLLGRYTATRTRRRDSLLVTLGFPRVSTPIPASDTGPHTAHFGERFLVKVEVTARATASLPFSARSAIGDGDSVPIARAALKRRVLSDRQIRIFVGRAAVNDVVIADASVSKVHACFTLDVSRALAGPDTTGLAVADATSRNGTRLNGVPVSERCATEVQIGDLVTFGGVTCEVLDARALHATLRRLPRS